MTVNFPPEAPEATEAAHQLSSAKVRAVMMDFIPDQTVL